MAPAFDPEAADVPGRSPYKESALHFTLKCPRDVFIDIRSKVDDEEQ